MILAAGEEFLYYTASSTVFLSAYALNEVRNGRQEANEIIEKLEEDHVHDILERDKEHIEQDKLYKQALNLVLRPYRAGRYAELKTRINNLELEENSMDPIEET